jgi:hypothetical protein
MKIRKNLLRYRHKDLCLFACCFLSKMQGKTPWYYAHTDYQGSLTALSLPDGTVAERYAYDPWGKRRNPDNWSQDDTRTAFILNRGYTMHEHLPEFNLINMNGRVYVPTERWQRQQAEQH